MKCAATRSYGPGGSGSSSRSTCCQSTCSPCNSACAAALSEGHGGDVDSGDLPSPSREPERVGSFAAAHVERRTRCQGRGLVDEHGIGVAAPHPLRRRAVAVIPFGFGEWNLDVVMDAWCSCSAMPAACLRSRTHDKTFCRNGKLARWMTWTRSCKPSARAFGRCASRGESPWLNSRRLRGFR